MTNPRDDLMAPEIDLHTYCGADARRWAEAFSQIKARQGWSVDDIDTDLMIGWFANAIEVACALRLAASRPAPQVVDREAAAWIITWSDGETSFTRSAPSASSPKNCKYQPLYTHPPKSPDTSAEEMREALLDATANLVGAASAYRKHAARHRSIGRAIADPFFTARAGDLEKAAERAQAAIRQLPTTDTSAAVLAERERCAAIADEWANKMARNHGRETANTIAAAIRQLPTTERGD